MLREYQLQVNAIKGGLVPMELVQQAKLCQR